MINIFDLGHFCALCDQIMKIMQLQSKPNCGAYQLQCCYRGPTSYSVVTEGRSVTVLLQRADQLQCCYRGPISYSVVFVFFAVSILMIYIYINLNVRFWDTFISTCFEFFWIPVFV